MAVPVPYFYATMSWWAIRKSSQFIFAHLQGWVQQQLSGCALQQPHDRIRQQLVPQVIGMQVITQKVLFGAEVASLCRVVHEPSL